MEEKFLVFTGRPNAGKSSLIKEIIGIDLKIGKRPGTTRKISKYPLNEGLVLVDMPGFGRMLGVSKRWEDIINNRIIRFLESNAQKIVAAVHVLDISTFLEVTRRLEKKGFISVDVENVLFLTNILGETPFIAANKIDKADEIELDANISEFINQIKEGYPSDVSDYIFPVSAKTGERLGSLKNAIHKKLVVKGFRTPFKIR